jgi:hypothetical protein
MYERKLSTSYLQGRMCYEGAHYIQVCVHITIRALIDDSYCEVTDQYYKSDCSGDSEE